MPETHLNNRDRSLRREIHAPKQLLVEGRTAEIFFREWIQDTQRHDDIQVRDFGSIAELTGYLKVFCSQKKFKELVSSLGIIRDAETSSPHDAFQSVRASLEAAGLTSPSSLGHLSNGTPKTSIYILPDCNQNGMLESLCWMALHNDPDHEHHTTCVVDYINCVRQKISVQNQEKAKVWAFLAGFGDFDPLLGRAAQAKLWKWDCGALAHLAEYLKSL